MNHLNVDILSKNGPALVILHGWGWHSGIWFPLLPSLVQHYQIYLIDLPGFGKNAHIMPATYSFEEIAPFLLEVAPDKSAWLGWSMGGLFATWMAAHFPDRVNQLITIASTPKFVRQNDWPGLEDSTLEKFSHLLNLNHEKTLQDFLELQLRGSPNRNALLAELETIIQMYPPTQDALSKGLMLLRETDLREDAPKIHCPSLHIFGQLDTIVPVKVIESLLPLYTDGKFEVIGRTGHMPFLSQQDSVIQLIKQFLS